jgi:Mo-dependent nitrogenase C-terminus
MLNRIKQLLDNIQVENVNQANLLCNLIPAVCPFARIICVGKVQVVIPPLCKINPLYDDLMMLRFKAQCYLAEVGRV